MANINLDKSKCRGDHRCDICDHVWPGFLSFFHDGEMAVGDWVLTDPLLSDRVRELIEGCPMGAVAIVASPQSALRAEEGS